MSASRRIEPATALFAAAAFASGVLLLVLQSQLTFFYDDWDVLLGRRGLSADSLLRPHHGHLLLGNTVVYKSIQETIGMESLLPYAVASTATFLLSVALLFVYLRRRVGGWLALAGVLPVLFLGAASTDLLFPFQIFFFGAMASGLGALLAIERADPRRDALACALLVVSMTFSELAIPFAFGVAVKIARDGDALRRAYVVVVPLLLYAAWYAGWGHTDPSALSFENVANVVPYVLDGLASGVASFFGLISGELASATAFDWGRPLLGWGRPLLLAALVLAALRLRSRVPLGWSVPVTLVILLSFWLLTALNANELRTPDEPRYQYVGVVLLLLVAANLAAGVIRPRTPAIVLALGVAAVAAIGNVDALRDTFVGFDEVTPTVRGGLAGLELAADSVDSELELDEENSGFPYIRSVQAGPYLSAVDAFGSPAYSESELAEAPERARVAADLVTGTALGLVLQPATRTPTAGLTAPRLAGSSGSLVAERPGCITVEPDDGPPVVSLPPGGALLRAPAGATVEVGLRRFASESFPVSAGVLTGSAALPIPEDRSGRGWQAQLDAEGPVTACGLRAG